MLIIVLETDKALVNKILELKLRRKSSELVIPENKLSKSLITSIAILSFVQKKTPINVHNCWWQQKI